MIKAYLRNLLSLLCYMSGALAVVLVALGCAVIAGEYYGVPEIWQGGVFVVSFILMLVLVITLGERR